MCVWRTVLSVAVALSTCTLEVAALKSRAAVEVPDVTSHAPAKPEAPPTAEQVQALRAKLEKMSSGLEAASGAISATKIGPELKTFMTELRAVLSETKGMADNTMAMKKLEAARQGVVQLTKDLTARQEKIMMDVEKQQESLLLGVLMTRQKEFMSEQLKVLTSEDFAALPVSKALLAKHNNSSPLFSQAAAYLDTHAAVAPELQGTLNGMLSSYAARVRSGAGKKPKQADMAPELQRTLDGMLSSYAARVQSHAKREKDLKANLKNSKSKKSRHAIQALLKREERNFKKWSVTQRETIDTMQKAVTAVKNGDMKAVDQARSALQHSMEALKNKNAGFLVLLSLGHQLMERDCPYCVAQCVGKCHQAGKPYTQCMTDCANAGQ